MTSKDPVPDDVEEILIERPRVRARPEPEPRWSIRLRWVGWFVAAVIAAMVLGLEVKWHRERAEAPTASSTSD